MLGARSMCGGGGGTHPWRATLSSCTGSSRVLARLLARSAQLLSERGGFLLTKVPSPSTLLLQAFWRLRRSLPRSLPSLALSLSLPSIPSLPLPSLPPPLPSLPSFLGASSCLLGAPQDADGRRLRFRRKPEHGTAEGRRVGRAKAQPCRNL